MTSSTQRYAVVPSYGAAWLLERLRKGNSVTSSTVRSQALALRAMPERQYPAAARYAAELEGAWAQLVAAKDDHQLRTLTPPLEVPISVGGNAEVALTEVQRGLHSSEEISTQEAASMLHITPRRVGQKIAAGELSGRKVGRSWAVDRSSVVALCGLRRAS